MTAMQGALSSAERSMRSVFVGNIPYEATEEQLKDIFCEVGPVVSFRLVYDRETGKPKGYGFCEYKDQEMALSAMRNLNGYELNGRALRVDNAASEKSKEELKNLQASLGGPPVESPFGPEVSPDKAPEAISRVITSLPPEQLYELMTQMKMCIENNPNEARTLLMQNPQLGYALLQAQVVMKIIEPELAMGMLHSSDSPPLGLLPTPSATQVPPISNSQIHPPPSVNEVSHAFSSAMSSTPALSNPPVNVPRSTAVPPVKPSLLGDGPPIIAPPPLPPSLASPIANQFPERDPRIMDDQDLRPPPLIDHDMRHTALSMMTGDKDMRHPPMGDEDLRMLHVPPGLPENRSYNDPRYRNTSEPDMGLNRGPPFDRPQIGLPPDVRLGPRLPPNVRPGPRMPSDVRPGPRMPSDVRPAPRMPSDVRPAPRMPSDVRPGFEGRGVVGMSPRLEDQRNAVIPPMPNGPPCRATPQNRTGFVNSESPNAVSSPRPGNKPLTAAATAVAAHDQEKAALIMQVLQLTDQQIAMLHPEQRQSIMILKEQIARSQQAS